MKENVDVGGGLAAYRARIQNEKRRAILDAAIHLFLETGYDRTSLEAIAREAQVSTGTLFKHFPTKSELFGAIMSRAWDNDPGATALAPVPGDPAKGLKLIGLDYARLLRAPGIEPLFRLVISEVPRFPELGIELYERGKAPYLARLDRYLREEAKSGKLAFTESQFETAAREFLGMINDQIFWPRMLVTDLEIDEQAVNRVVVSATRTFLSRYGRKDNNAAERRSRT